MLLWSKGLTIRLLGNVACFLLYADFFHNQLLRKNLSGIPSDCQTLWIQIWLDILSGHMGLNCLDRLSAEDNCLQRINLFFVDGLVHLV